MEANVGGKISERLLGVGPLLPALDRVVTRSAIGRITAYDYVVVGRRGSNAI